MNITYSGDNNYDPVTNITDFSVDKVEPEIDINTTGNITVTLPEDAKGNVTVVITNNDTGENTTIEAPLVNGTAVIPIDDLPAGNYTVNVTYSGDDNYDPVSNVTDLTVDLINPDMKVNISEAAYGEGETITIALPEDATGNVSVTVTNKETGETKTISDVPLVNGTAVVTVDNLTAGDYEVEVVYSGDNKYNSTTVTDTFNISKAEPVMDVNISEMAYNTTGNVTVTLPEDATGNVTVVITNDDTGETTVIEGTLVNGTVTVPVDGLPAGNYTVNVTYSGDDNYDPVSNVTDFSVDKVEPEMDINTTGNITVTLPEDATGNVTVVITDNDTGETITIEAPLENGTVTIPIDDLPPGNYTVNVTYGGDDNYDPISENASLNVPKADVTVDVESENIVYGTDEPITVTVNSVKDDATGTVNITITGTVYTDDGGRETVTYRYDNVDLVNGAASITLDLYDAGNYTVDAVYSGDKNYNGNNGSSEFEIAKATPELNLNVENITVGDIERIIITADTYGTVDVTVNEETVTLDLNDGYEKRVFAAILSDSGKATLELENLAVGTYPVTVHFNGNRNYLATDIVGSFNVAPKETSMSVTVENVTVGGDETITVEFSPNDVPGNVTVTVNGKPYTVNIENGVASLTLSDLSSGSYVVTVEYDGNENYTSCNATTSFVIEKVKPTMDVDYDVIKVGEDEVIVVTLPDDATGTVSAIVGGRNYTVPVKDGTAVIVIPGLLAGNHTIDVIYSGDDIYGSVIKSITVEVERLEMPIDVVIPPIHEGENGTIIVTVPDDATGTITIEIDGKNYTAPIIDGKAIFNIPDLKPGKHRIKIFYSGDDKYLPFVIDDGGDIIVIKNGTGNHTHKKHSGIDLSAKKTGNPIFMLLWILIILFLIPLRRFKK